MEDKHKWFMLLEIPSEKLNPTEFLNKFPKNYYLTPSEFKINNIVGLKEIYGGAGAEVENMVLFNNPTVDLFVFSLYPDEKQKEKAVLFNKILSTFKFLD